jgi:hypothetical protein
MKSPCLPRYLRMNVMRSSDSFRCTSEIVLDRCLGKSLEKSTLLKVKQIQPKNASNYKTQHWTNEDANYLIAKFNIIIDERHGKSCQNRKNSTGGYDETALNNENFDLIN